MRPIWSLIFLTSLLALIAGSSLALAEPAPFRIGVIAPLSGEMAVWGERLRRGVELASAASTSRHEIFFEDDQLQSASSVSAYKKLRAEKKIDAVIVFGSGIGHVIAPLAEKESVITVAVGASDSKIAAGRSFAFTHWVSPEMEARAMLPEMEARRYSSIALISAEHEGLIAITSELKESLKHDSKEDLITVERSVLPQEKDFRGILPLVSSKKPSAVCALLFPVGTGMLAKQLRDGGYNGDIFGADTLDDPSAQTAAQGALGGAWYAVGNVGTDEFKKTFAARYGEEPGPSSCNAYDTIMIILNAVEEGGRGTREIASRMKNLKNFSGACGKYDATGDGRFALPAVIKIVPGQGSSSQSSG